MFIDNYMKNRAREHALAMATFNVLLDEIDQQRELATDESTTASLDKQEKMLHQAMDQQESNWHQTLRRQVKLLYPDPQD